MAGFLDALNGLYKNVGSDGDNETEVAACTTRIPVSTFHLYLLGPSAVLILVLATTVPRKNRATSCCWGRPGAVFPMDILGKSNRFSYAAAWGAIAYLATDLVFGDVTIVTLEGPPYVTVFTKVCETLIIAVDYMPLFASLALESIIGYIIGTAYAWTILGVHIYRETECDLVVQTRLILILRDLPNLLCLGYLSISLPARTIQSLRARSVRIASSSEMVSILNMEKDIMTSPEAEHVTSLLKPAPPPPPPPATMLKKIGGIVLDLIHNWIYHNKHKFRYSSRIISVMLMGLLLVYKVTLEVTVFVISILIYVEDGFISTLTLIGWEKDENEEGYITEIRDYTYLMYYILINGRICFIVAISLTCLGSILTILHMLSSYRTNLFDLYKGDNTHIPHRSTRSNTSLLVGSMRFAGYQVAYIAWGYVLHFIILLLLSMAIVVIITMIQNDFYQWMIDLLAVSWPAGVMTIIILLTQTLLAKFAFLQEKGELLAINNRRWLFTFSFFMFFYNIFVGFLSCLLRIIKSIAIGAIFLPRLDNSALPRRFQMFDPGFANYVGFIHLECTHTHPVMLMFLRLLMIDIKTGDEKNKMDDTTGNEKSKLSLDPNEVVVEMCGGKVKSTMSTKNRRKMARNRWNMAYTLTNNPSLRIMRKCYMAYLNEIQERLARKYNINSQAMGKLVTTINNQFMATGGTDLEQVAEEVVAAEVKSARANWNAMLGMTKFMKLQKTISQEQATSSANTDEQDGSKVQQKVPLNRWMKALAAQQPSNNDTENSSHL